MKKHLFKALGLAVAICAIQGCDQNLEQFDEPIIVDAQKIESCDCFTEVFAPKPGKLQNFGKGENELILENHGGIKVFEGDIELSEAQIAIMTATSSEGDEGGRTESTGRATVAARWPGKVVPYVINASLPSQSRVTSAIAHWEANTDYDFVPRTNQANYIEFISSTGCSSSVGMVGGRQFIRLASGCTTGNTIHEIGHAVGLWHEHTRADRDYTVNINWGNIQAGRENNFRYYNTQNFSGFDNGPFDFGSIMLYSSNAFSTSTLPTIVRKNGTTFTAQRSALSAGDIAGAEYIYNAVDLPSPTNIVASHDGDEELTVTWNAVPGATEYWIYNLDETGQPYFYRIRTGTTYSRELKQKFRAAYRIWISARDANGNTGPIREASYTWK